MTTRDKILELTREYYAENHPKSPIPGENNIPVSGKVIEAEDLEMIVDSCLDMWFTTGRFAKEFEKEFAKFNDQKHCLIANSGSSANLIAFATLTSHKLEDRMIKPGDEVITVAAGFPTTVNPIIQHGCIPVFVDVDKETHNIDISHLEMALSSKTKAIMIAHTLGNPFDLESVKEFCDKNNLWLIEDCCDAVGAKFNGKLVGTYGDIATVSFYPAHHITMGEGGAVLTNSTKLKKIAESFRDWGRDCWCPTGMDNSCKKRFNWELGDLPRGYDHKYIYSHVGYNLKVTDMQAALGLSQLKKLSAFIEKRNSNAEYLKKKLTTLTDFIHLPKATKGSTPSWFGFPISLIENSQFKRKDLINFLEENKISTRLLFAGNLIKQPMMKNVKYRVVGSLKNTDNIMENTFWVGIYPALNQNHLDYISDKLHSFFGVKA